MHVKNVCGCSQSYLGSLFVFSWETACSVEFVEMLFTLLVGLFVVALKIYETIAIHILRFASPFRPYQISAWEID